MILSVPAVDSLSTSPHRAMAMPDHGAHQSVSAQS
jgi:hypothetical protein